VAPVQCCLPHPQVSLCAAELRSNSSSGQLHNDLSLYDHLSTSGGLLNSSPSGVNLFSAQETFSLGDSEPHMNLLSAQETFFLGDSEPPVNLLSAQETFSLGDSEPRTSFQLCDPTPLLCSSPKKMAMDSPIKPFQFSPMDS